MGVLPSNVEGEFIVCASVKRISASASQIMSFSAKDET
jgi:hypothetical protein